MSTPSTPPPTPEKKRSQEQQTKIGCVVLAVIGLLIWMAFLNDASLDSARSTADPVAVPSLAPAAGETNLADPAKPRCVYNRSDDRFIGAALSSRPAPDGVNTIVRVAVDPELSGRAGEVWEITVPKNGRVGECKR